MKTLTKSAVILVTLLGSSLTQAGNTTASIPMGVDVPKSCTFSNVSAGIVVPEDGTEVTGNFTTNCNTNLDLRITTLSSVQSGNNTAVISPAGTRLRTQLLVEFLGFGKTQLNQWIGYGSGQGGSYTGTFYAKLTDPVTAVTPAGIYTDTINMTLTF